MLLAVCGKGERGRDVFIFKVWEILEDLFAIHSSCEVFEDISDRDAHPADAGLSAALVGLDRDSLSVFHGHNHNRFQGFRRAFL